MKKLFIILLLLNLNINYAQSIEADVFVQSTVNRASDVLSKNISKEDKIDILINKVGVGVSGPIEETRQEDILEAFRIN